MNMAFGDNGLIKQAQKAKDMAANSVIAEQEGMNNLMGEFANTMREDSEIPDPEIPFEPQPTPEPEQGDTFLTDEDRLNGVIEIKWLSGTSNKVSETPNAPQVKTISNGTMELVKYTGEGSTEKERWVAGTEYSYLPGEGSSDNISSKWANARVTIDGIDSYFVWIPRYAYRIIYFDSAESKKAYQEGTLTEADAKAQGKIKGYSDSRGIVDSEGKKVAYVTCTTKEMVSEDYFMTHPAFMNGTSTGYTNGEWSTDVEGIWIGKYEASLANKSDGTNIVPSSSTDANILLSAPENSDKTIVTKPGYSNWRYTTIGNCYDNAKYYSTELESHMLKNSEWGAVAYLTESKYGRNGTEIGYNDEYITGGGANNAYAKTNQDQSTTGNVYGIYDMCGGADEYVASYYTGGYSSILNNGSSFTNTKTSDKYATAYTGTNAYASYKYGDATYETSGWHSDLSLNVNSYEPFFGRGGRPASNYYVDGVFSFGGTNGYAGDFGSFRLTLVV